MLIVGDAGAGSASMLSRARFRSSNRRIARGGFGRADPYTMPPAVAGRHLAATH